MYKEFKQIRVGLAIGLLAWLVVVFIWAPFLHAEHHLYSFGMSQAKEPYRLIAADSLLVFFVPLGQGLLSGIAGSFSPRTLRETAIVEIFVPWVFEMLWFTLTAPPIGYYKLFEVLSWGSIPIVLNAVVIGLFRLTNWWNVRVAPPVDGVTATITTETYGYKSSTGFKRQIKSLAGQALIVGLGFPIVVLLSSWLFRAYTPETTGPAVGIGICLGLVQGIRPYLWSLIVKNERVEIREVNLSYYNLVGNRKVDCPLSKIHFVRGEALVGDWLPAAYIFSDGVTQFRVLANVDRGDELFPALGRPVPTQKDKGGFD